MEQDGTKKPDGYYHLKKNGKLIYSNTKIEDEKFVMIWEVDLLDRSNAWNIAIEASLLGAKKSRINELIQKWQLFNSDASFYARKNFIQLWSEEKEKTFKCRFVDNEEVVGEGPSAFEAILDLYKKRIK